MQNKKIGQLLESISYSIASTLNENGYDSKERQMYEQDKLENETWKQMSDRVGFTEWYKSLGLVAKNIGDVYAKRRQRWLANNCKNQAIIKNEICNLEDCIEFAYLNDDNYVSSNVEKDDYIKQLKDQIVELNARIDKLTKNIPSTALNLKDVDIQNTFDEYLLRFRNPYAIDMFCKLKDKLRSFKADAYPGGTIEMWRYNNKKEKGDFERYKALIVTCQEDNSHIRHDILKIVNIHFNINCTEKEIYIISLTDRGAYTGNWILKENANAFRQFMQMANPNVKIQKYDDRVNGQYLFFYLIECE